MEDQQEISKTAIENLKVDNHNHLIDKEQLRKTINQLKLDKASAKLDPKTFKDPKITNAVKKRKKFDKNTSPCICLQQELTLDYI